jgi:flagellar motor protein MotB
MDRDEFDNIKDQLTLLTHVQPSQVVIEEDSDDSEGWLISYADMMTLVACFFILMTTFANYDTSTFEVVAKEVKKTFQRC